MKTKVLFVCVQNSARSQMAEAWLNHLCSDSFQAKSAGFEPGALNPLAVEAMAEVGIDISQKPTKSVFNMYKAGEFFGYVIGVCDREMFEKCPVFPAPVQRVNWSIPDPAKSPGTREEQLQRFREVRDLIRGQVEEWCADKCGAQLA
jgi:arsenate reductase